MSEWGYHLILDASGCDHEKITNKENVENFARALVQRINMVPYGEPQVVNFGSGDQEGFTLVQLIETSNITAHFANASDTMFLDVFSCKVFDKKVVKSLVKEYFQAGKIKSRFHTRQAP